MQAAGSPRIWTGLAAGTTYYFYVYGLAVDGTIHFGSGDPPASPPNAPDSASALACYYDGRYPLGVVTVTTPATSGGSGSGSGTGGPVCPAADELVDVEGRGAIPAGQVNVGDRLRGVSLQTGATIYRRVVGKMIARSSTWRMVEGRRLSPVHDVWIEGKWQQPWRIGTFDSTPADRVQLTVETDGTYDEQNFVLVNEDGSTALILHNAPIVS